MSKVSVSITPLVSIGRVFRDGGKYGDPYSDTFVVNHDSPDTVTISGARGTLSRAVLRMIGTELLLSGVRTVRCFRTNGHRVPGGELVARGEIISEWRIDLVRAMELSK